MKWALVCLLPGVACWIGLLWIVDHVAGTSNAKYVGIPVAIVGIVAAYKLDTKEE